MKVGDLVKARTREREALGFIIEICYPVVTNGPPDYRTPTSVLVHFSELQPAGLHGELRLQQWYHKNELELVSAP